MEPRHPALTPIGFILQNCSADSTQNYVYINRLELDLYYRLNSELYHWLKLFDRFDSELYDRLKSISQIDLEI